MNFDPEKYKRYLQSDEYKKAVAEQQAQFAREEEVVEKADWFGKTGLDDALERELPRYLRRELGESVFDEGALKADDLEYLGRFPARQGLTHFWRMPSSGQRAFAYVEPWEDGYCLGWGDLEPGDDV